MFPLPVVTVMESGQGRSHSHCTAVGPLTGLGTAAVDLGPLGEVG